MHKNTANTAAKQSLLDAALSYHAAGLPVIMVSYGKDNKLIFPKDWARYRAEQTADQVRALFSKPCDLLAILCGNGVEGIDIDVKHDPGKTIDQEFFDLVREDEIASAALDKCVLVRTKSDGWHIVYRAENIEGNQKLALRNGGKEAVIETRGTGGLLFAAPSPGYRIEQGDYTKLQLLTNAERDALITCARILSERPEAHAADTMQAHQNGQSEKPWDVYNAKHDVAELLDQYGWREVRRSGDKIYLNRPGAEHPEGIDGTILITRTGNRRFFPHTTSSKYDPGKCYSPFGIYAIEEHGGAIKSAVKALAKTGYGSARKSRKGAKKPNGATNGQINSENGMAVDEPAFCSNLKVAENRYWWTTYKEVRGETKESEFEISNFIIEPLYHLKSPTNPKRVFVVNNIHGKKEVICAPVKELAGSEKFKGTVEGAGNFVASWNTRQFSAIKERWFYFEKPAIELETLGHISGTNLFAWANGIFDGTNFIPVNEFGILETGGQSYFIPAFSSIFADNTTAYNHERRFAHNPDSKTTFEPWARLFNAAFSENNNGMIGIVFACAAVFRTTIAAHTNFFPLLFLFGMKGTGKSTFRDALLSLFGQPQDAISLGSASTSKGFNRRLAQFQDAMICFEEYKNGIPAQLIEMLKSAYDGIGYERAQTSNDNRTHSTPVRSAVVVAGQELATKENALFSRTITVEFDRTEFTEAQIEAYDAFIDIQHGEGVTAATLEILRWRALIEEQFVSTYREMCQWLKESKSPDGEVGLPANVDERSINNTACLLAIYRILEKHLKFPFTFVELFDTLIFKLRMQVELMNKTTEVNQFWDAVEVLISHNYLMAGRDYRIDDKDGEHWIFIYPTTVFAAYRDQMRRTGGVALDGATLKQYLKLQPGFRPGKGRPDHQMRLTEEGPSERTTPKWCLAFELGSTNMAL